MSSVSPLAIREGGGNDASPFSSAGRSVTAGLPRVMDVGRAAARRRGTARRDTPRDRGCTAIATLGKTSPMRIAIVYPMTAGRSFRSSRCSSALSPRWREEAFTPRVHIQGKPQKVDGQQGQPVHRDRNSFGVDMRPGPRRGAGSGTAGTPRRAGGASSVAGRPSLTARAGRSMRCVRSTRRRS